jgi:hypothetical protein
LVFVNVLQFSLQVFVAATQVLPGMHVHLPGAANAPLLF